MEIINNKSLSRFESMQPDGEYAILEYRWLKGSMVLMHTFVPDSGRGTGAGSALVKFMLDYVRENRLKIIVYCTFVAAYLKRHPGYEDLIDKQGRD